MYHIHICQVLPPDKCECDYLYFNDSEKKAGEIFEKWQNKTIDTTPEVQGIISFWLHCGCFYLYYVCDVNLVDEGWQWTWLADNTMCLWSPTTLLLYYPWSRCLFCMHSLYFGYVQHLHGLVGDYSICCASAMAILQFCTKPLICC